MRRKDKIKKIALERINKLFNQAENTQDVKLCDRYVFLSRKIANKANIHVPKKFKRKFCKHCYAYFIPSKTCRVRLTKKKNVSTLCFKCQKRTRIPFTKKKKVT
jgi:ribonuclease P protein subunit RPR2